MPLDDIMLLYFLYTYVQWILYGEFHITFHHNILAKCSKRLVVLKVLDSPVELYVSDGLDTICVSTRASTTRMKTCSTQGML